MRRPALQNKQVVILRMAFRVRKVIGTFEKRAPGTLLFASARIFICLFLFLFCFPGALSIAKNISKYKVMLELLRDRPRFEFFPLLLALKLSPKIGRF